MRKTLATSHDSISHTCLEFRYENLDQVLDFCRGNARVPLHLAGDYTLMVKTPKGEQGAHYATIS